MNFAELCAAYDGDVPEGSIMGTIVGLCELIWELKNVGRVIGRPDLQSKADEAIELRRRDVIFAASRRLGGERRRYADYSQHVAVYTVDLSTSGQVVVSGDSLREAHQAQNVVEEPRRDRRSNSSGFIFRALEGSDSLLLQFGTMESEFS
ncbi:superkiller viralicidic activity 2-like W [Gracilaria domingensis]|nr:superkiller viralicidic activity 2-like W [Gracilaria domingensis]